MGTIIKSDSRLVGGGDQIERHIRILKEIVFTQEIR